MFLPHGAIYAPKFVYEKGSAFVYGAGEKRTPIIFDESFVEYTTRTYHRRSRAAERTAGGEAVRSQQGGATAHRFAEETIAIFAFPAVENNCLFLNVYPQARTNEFQFKPIREQSTVDQRFIRGNTGTLRSWLLTSVRTAVCLSL